ncbi:MAG: helix-turn-helix domain-containing protein [Pseudomonadota bacterium]
MAPKQTVRGSTTGRPIMRLLDAMGKRWSLRILWELRDKPLTFRELQTRCDDISPTSLNTRLKELREMELVELTDQGYAHTAWGTELGTHLVALDAWAAKWAAATACEDQ